MIGPARSSAECRLYMELHGCSCGASEVEDLEHRVENRAEGLVAVYAGRCKGCGQGRSFEFLLDPDLPPAPPAFGGNKPSAIIDAGEFLAVADDAARRVPAKLDDLDAGAREGARRLLGRAVAALDEVLKHIPAGQDRVSEAAITSEPGRQLYQAEPGRFRRARVEAVREVYRKSLEQLSPPPASGGGSLPREPGRHRYFIAGARPVRMTRLADGGLRVVALDWKTGELVPDLTYLGRITSGDPEIDEVDEAGFEEAMVAALATIKKKTPKPPRSLAPAEIETNLVEGFEGVDIERALGALLGLAIGEVLGTSGASRTVPVVPFPGLTSGPVHDIAGGGPLGLARGQVSGGSAMAAALADRLTSGPRLSTDALLADYAAWSRVALDVGRRAPRALELAAQSSSALDAGRRAWEEADRATVESAGNGSLARTAPIGVLLARAGDTRRLVSMADSAITHFDPRCQLACIAFNGAIARAVTTDLGPGAIVDAAEVELDRGAALLRRTYPELTGPVEEAFAALASDLAAARRDDPSLYEPGLHLRDTPGFVRVPFRLAFWELLHAPDLESALIDVPSRGGDAGTNAAVCGALWGAVAGVRAVRPAWLRAVVRAPGLSTGARSFHPDAFLRALWRASGGRTAWADALAPLAGETPAELLARLAEPGSATVEIRAEEARSHGLPPIAIRIDTAGAGVTAHRFSRPGNYVVLTRVDERPAGKLIATLSVDQAQAADADLAAIERHLRSRAVDAVGRPVPVLVGEPGEVTIAGARYQAMAAAFGSQEESLWYQCCGTLVGTEHGALFLMMSAGPVPSTAGVLACGAVAGLPAFAPLLRGISIAGRTDPAPRASLEITPEEAQAHGLPSIGIRLDITGTGMTASRFPQRDNYVHLAARDGTTVFSISASAETGTGIPAVERAVRAVFSGAEHQPVKPDRPGEVIVAGQRHPALAFTTGLEAQAARTCWCGTLVATGQGALLVAMGVRTARDELTCAEISTRAPFQALLHGLSVVAHAPVRSAPRADLESLLGAFAREAAPQDDAIRQLGAALASMHRPLAAVIRGETSVHELPGALAAARDRLGAARSGLLAVSDDPELVRLADGRLWLAELLEQCLREPAPDARALAKIQEEFLENQRAWQIEMTVMISRASEIAEIVDSVREGAEIDGAVAAQLRRLRDVFAASEKQHRWTSQPARADFARFLGRHARLVDALLALVDVGAEKRS